MTVITKVTDELWEFDKMHLFQIKPQFGETCFTSEKLKNKTAVQTVGHPLQFTGQAFHFSRSTVDWF